MVIKLLPSQISIFWEAIKYAITSAAGATDLTELLHSLLNDTSQCFVKFKEDRVLLAILVTKLNVHKITGERGLQILGLYSWQGANDKEWKEEFEFVRKFAEYEKCKYIAFESQSPRIWELGVVLGFKETLRRFKLNLG